MPAGKDGGRGLSALAMARVIDLLRTAFLLALATTQAAAPFVFFHDIGTGLMSPRPTPIVPAGYAFAIWGVIFLLSIVFAVVQALPGARDREPIRIVGWPLGIVFALCWLWLRAASTPPQWQTLPIFAAMLGLLMAALFYVARSSLAGVARLVTMALLGLYTGWSSVAIFANLSEFLGGWRIDWFIAGQDEATIVLLAAAVMTSLIGAFAARGSWFYTGAVGWALAAIAAANVTREIRPAIVATCLIALAVLVVATIWFRWRGGRVAITRS